LINIASVAYILCEKYIYILAVEMASPGNQHRASFIGTLSFPGPTTDIGVPWWRYALYQVLLPSFVELVALKWSVQPQATPF